MESRNCYLAMFDIIGFKVLRNELGTDGLYKKYKNSIQPIIEHSAAGKGKSVKVNGKSLYVPDFTEISVNYKIISDSTIFYTEDASFSSFVNIMHSSHMLLQLGFNGLKSPYRGAIAYGDLIDDPNGTYIGSAVEEAYIGEGAQVWSGCMLTKSCEEYADANGHINDYKNMFIARASEIKDNSEKEKYLLAANLITKYNTPLQKNPKNGPVQYYKEQHYVLDWTIKTYEGASGKSFKDSNDQHAILIKQNTENFENWARTNNRN